MLLHSTHLMHNLCVLSVLILSARLTNPNNSTLWYVWRKKGRGLQQLLTSLWKYWEELRLAVSKLSTQAPAAKLPALHAFTSSITHSFVHVIAALLKLLLNLLLQEVDPKLQAEVLLLQVVQVLRDGAATRETRVRHGDRWRRLFIPPHLQQHDIRKMTEAAHGKNLTIVTRSAVSLSPAFTHQQAGIRTLWKH